MKNELEEQKPQTQLTRSDEFAVQPETQKAIQEVQARLIIAKKFPRDEVRAYARIMKACRRVGLAEAAEYAYPRGGKTVRGPSIRLAEVLINAWGNSMCGVREMTVDRETGETRMQAFAWDLETNVIDTKEFNVRHIRERTAGNVRLTGERDIYELGANMAARRKRACILTIIPADVVEDAVMQCRKTLAEGYDEPLEDRIRNMVVAFAEYGVLPEHISEKLCKDFKACNNNDFVNLRGWYNSIQAGIKKPEEIFPITRIEEKDPVSVGDLFAENKEEKPKGKRKRRTNAQMKADAQKEEEERKALEEKASRATKRMIIGRLDDLKKEGHMEAVETATMKIIGLPKYSEEQSPEELDKILQAAKKEIG